ncbi:MAG: class I SAM-dependent methyltransferase [Verrucomicrobiota bacterium]|nr:class I SAM-dependent methyltransferase [Verrucomicrobiota bacterium]
MTQAVSGTTAPFHCLLCGGSESEMFLDHCRDLYMGKPGEFTYYRCRQCSLVQLYPIPADLGSYYDSYGVHQQKSRLHELLRRLLMTRGYYFPPAIDAGLNVVDFGCGDGWYVREMKSLGHDVVGFETNPGHAGQLSQQLGVPIYSDTTTLCAEHAAELDLFTMHFVLEHVTDVKGTFAIAEALLKPGGIFYFVIPNLDSMEFHLFGRRWHGLDAPRHISFPSRSVISDLAKDHGFVVERIDSFGLPTDVAGSLSNAALGHYDHRAFAVFMPIALLWSSTFAQGDLRVLLRKGPR